MTAEATEFDVLQSLMPELEAEGYEVYLHPNRPLLPEFLRDFTPDAIALRKDKNLAIEVMRKSPDGERKKERIADLFKGHDDWALRVVWIEPVGSAATPQSQSLSLIRTRVVEIRELARKRHFQSAFLLAWATLEAVGRVLAPAQLQRPQTPGRLIEVLAMEGYLTPTEADDLRPLIDKRNKLVHGDLKTRISESEVGRLTDILVTMIRMAGK
jgi:uncharacterized protein YutE (UPF0331/DUF86 family)